MNPGKTAAFIRGKYFMPTVLVAAFVLTYPLLGNALHVDSYQFIYMHIRRDPVYPLFLFLLRKLFNGADTYLFAAGFIQTVFNALALSYFASSLSRILKKDIFFSWICAFFGLIPYVLTRFFSETSINLAGDIMSESFTYPLFLIFFILTLRFTLENKKELYKDKDVYASFFTVLIITLTRGQLMALIVVWFLAALLRLIRDAKKKHEKNSWRFWRLLSYRFPFFSPYAPRC